jgi:Flp pilus assembly protein TadG
MTPMRALRTRLARRTRRFGRDRRGVAAIEFALIVPILVVLALGCFEVPRLVLTWQRISRTSSGIADLVAQADDPLTSNQMRDIFTAGGLMMQPYSLYANGTVVVNSINNPSTTTGVTITWRQSCGQTVNSQQNGKFGSVGGTPNGNFPTALLPTLNNEVLTAEVYFRYQPVFATVIYTGSTFYLAAYTRPRNHNLTTSPAMPAAACPS